MGADEVNAGQCRSAIDTLGQAPSPSAGCAHALYLPLQQQSRSVGCMGLHASVGAQAPQAVCAPTWLWADAVERCLSRASRPDAYRRCPALMPDVLLWWLDVKVNPGSVSAGGWSAA